MQNAISAARQRGPTRRQQPTHYAARVLRDVDAWTDPVIVRLINADDRGSLRETVTSWPRPGSDMPVAGDECVVVFDDTDEPIITAWKRPGWGTDA